MNFLRHKKWIIPAAVVIIAIVTIPLVISPTLQAGVVCPSMVSELTFGAQKVDNGMLSFSPSIRDVTRIADGHYEQICGNQEFRNNASNDDAYPPSMKVNLYEALVIMNTIHFRENTASMPLDLALSYPAVIEYDHRYYQISLDLYAPSLYILLHALLMIAIAVSLTVIFSYFNKRTIQREQKR